MWGLRFRAEGFGLLGRARGRARGVGSPKGEQEEKRNGAVGRGVYLVVWYGVVGSIW